MSTDIVQQLPLTQQASGGRGGEGRGMGREGGGGRGRGGWRGGGREKEEIECKTSGKLSHFLYSVYVVTIKWSMLISH